MIFKKNSGRKILVADSAVTVMVNVYRCLGCLEVFSSARRAGSHNGKCKAGYLTMTLDEFLKGKRAA